MDHSHIPYARLANELTYSIKQYGYNEKVLHMERTPWNCLTSLSTRYGFFLAAYLIKN